MRVVVDLQVLPGPARPRGSIDHYAVSLACAILRHAGNHDVKVVINHSSEEFLEKLQGKFPDLFRKGAFRVSRLPFLDTAKADGSWHRAAAELVREHALLQFKPDVVLCASLTGAGGAVLVSHLRCTCIPTAIALSELPSAIRPGTSPGQHVSTVPEPSRGSVNLKQQWQPALVLTVSEYCKRLLLDALELQTERVVVVPPGVDERFRPAVSEVQSHAVMTRFSLNKDFILSVAGGAQQGVERLFEAYASLPKELREANRLVVIGAIDRDQTSRLLQLARSKGLADGELVVAGEMSDDERAVFYNKSNLFVLPAWKKRLPNTRWTR